MDKRLESEKKKKKKNRGVEKTKKKYTREPRKKKKTPEKKGNTIAARGVFNSIIFFPVEKKGASAPPYWFLIYFGNPTNKKRISGKKDLDRPRMNRGGPMEAKKKKNTRKGIFFKKIRPLVQKVQGGGDVGPCLVGGGGFREKGVE